MTASAAPDRRDEEGAGAGWNAPGRRMSDLTIRRGRQDTRRSARRDARAPEAGDGVDARNGFVRGRFSGRDLAQRRAAMGEPQRAQRFGGLLQPDEGCRRSGRRVGFGRPRPVALRFERACAVDVRPDRLRNKRRSCRLELPAVSSAQPKDRSSNAGRCWQGAAKSLNLDPFPCHRPSRPHLRGCPP